ncbi:helix-turn-helix transcriptional regulator [Cytobacillus sp. S13-E01]|uniref:helix-turn-helix domain-containing protein n=1 Tax=Cytobacillus sp. S13-E01 TaxID=3031326 RepID=UPI0023D823AB|nr:helix-turn-helix transcriptional regulator [Cytobacillus sp. S13-E01]MDF0727779.1 helix-turn-helix transcriptional regulator [Cytobacillus sp. S13-E01]
MIQVKHIGDRIKELRIEHGMTLKELGEAIQFNYSNLSKIERGSRKPAIDFLENLSNYFDIEISYFFGEQKSTVNELDPNSLDLEIRYLAEEMKQKNISIEELKDLASTLGKMKNYSS